MQPGCAPAPCTSLQHQRRLPLHPWLAASALQPARFGRNDMQLMNLNLLDLKTIFSYLTDMDRDRIHAGADFAPSHGLWRNKSQLLSVRLQFNQYRSQRPAGSSLVSISISGKFYGSLHDIFISPTAVVCLR